MKKILILFFIFTTFIFGNKGKEIKIKAIINSNEYYYGYGVSEDFTESSEEALGNLIEQISVNVKSSFSKKVKSDSKNAEKDITQIIQTQSVATLENLSKINYQNENGEYYSFNYILKKDVEKIFLKRKELIYDLFVEAKANEKVGNITEALKLSYYCTILLNSLPGDIVSYDDTNFSLEIPNFINDIFSNIEFNYISDEKINKDERDITIGINYKKRPVSNINYNFWDGNQNVNVKGRDGLSNLRLYGGSTNMKELRVAIEYQFYNRKDEIKAVSNLWNLVKKPKFNQNIRVIKLKKNINKKSTNTQKKKENSVYKQMDLEIKRFNNLLDNKKLLKEYYAKDKFLYKKLENIFKHNNLASLKSDVDGVIGKTYNGYEFRAIYGKAKYRTLGINSIESLVLDFDEKGILRDVNFGITKGNYDKFKKASYYGKDWINREIILKFVEKYRTAFLTRDLNLINKIFAEDALIIVGRELKTVKGKNRYEKNKNRKIVYNRYNKKEYLRQLQSIFKSKKDISLDFSSFEITKKSRIDGVYGVSMRQNYRSTNYADEGHLFLLIDFNEQTPKIYVRSWQPNEWSYDEILNLSDFEIHK